MFQSTPLREGRLIGYLVELLFKCFNPRPCARGDINQFEGNNEYYRFQSTPLREGRRCTARLMTKNDMFQSTPLREGRHEAGWKSNAIIGFQSTPLREGRQKPK